MLDEAELVRLTEILDALDRDDYAMNATWKSAHELAMAHEGQPEFDWLHALCHRIEGDDSNAQYWYGKADRDFFQGSFRDEVREMLARLKEET